MLGLVLFSVASFAGGHRPVRGLADRRPGGPGPRRRDRLPGGAVDHHHHVRRGRRAQPRARHLGRGGGRRRRRRRAAGRDPHQRPELALGAVRQRPDRDPRRRAGAAHAAGEPPRGGRPHVRHPGRGRRSPPVSRCSSTRSSTPSTSAGERRGRSSAWPGAAVLLIAFVRDRAAPARSADAVLDLPPAHAARGQHRRPADRHVAVLDVLLHLAVPPERHALLADQDRGGLPPAGGGDHPLGRRGVAAGHPPGLQDAADRRAAADRRRAAVVLPGAGHRRLVRRRHPRPVAAGRRRAGLRVRPGDDRRRDRDPAQRGGAGVGADQHLPAGRRRARPGDPGHHRQQPDPGPAARAASTTRRSR